MRSRKKTATVPVKTNKSRRRRVKKIKDGTKTQNEEIVKAAYAGYLDEVKRLYYNNNVDIDSRDERGKTALMEACNEDNFSPEIVQFLIENGANLNLQDENGDTALSIAVQNHRGNELVAKLLQAGADDKLTNHEGKTPFQEAVQYYRPYGDQNLWRQGKTKYIDDLTETLHHMKIFMQEEGEDESKKIPHYLSETIMSYAMNPSLPYAFLSPESDEVDSFIQGVKDAYYDIENISSLPLQTRVVKDIDYIIPYVNEIRKAEGWKKLTRKDFKTFLQLVYQRMLTDEYNAGWGFDTVRLFFLTSDYSRYQLYRRYTNPTMVFERVNDDMIEFIKLYRDEEHAFEDFDLRM